MNDPFKARVDRKSNSFKLKRTKRACVFFAYYKIIPKMPDF